MGETAVKNKKPFGYYVCSLSFTIERMAFYSAKWLIAMFVVATVAKGGIGLTPADGAKMTANLVAFTYLAPLIGGYLSDHFIGARYCVPVGMILMGLGYLCGWQAQSAAMVNIMIILVSVGTGLFKGNNSAITGRLFDDPDQLDGAFSLQYSFVNIGSFIGTTAVGFIAVAAGYRFCFLLCGILMFIDAVWFFFGSRFLGEAGKKPFKFDKAAEHAHKETIENKPLTTIEKKRVAAIVLVSLFSVIFWIFWYLAYMPVYYYWGGDKGLANWMIGSFEIPTAWFDSLNAFCCITLGPVLGAVWFKLSKRPQGDLSMFKKTALGLVLLGVSYVVFALADVTRGGGQASILWILAFGILLSLGEMVFSPLGNSFISKFAPAKLLSVMMGVWIFSIFISGKCYGYLYEFTLKFDFSTVYFIIAAIAIISGVILAIMDKRLNRLVVEDEK
ncbi:MAG: peptide MFS transporter [Lachnospiraceae bacterium]